MSYRAGFDHWRNNPLLPKGQLAEEIQKALPLYAADLECQGKCP